MSDDTAEQLQTATTKDSIHRLAVWIASDLKPQYIEEEITALVYAVQSRTKQETRAAVIAEVRAGLPEKNSHTEKWQLSNGKQEERHVENKYDDFNRVIDAITTVLDQLEKDGTKLSEEGK